MFSNAHAVITGGYCTQINGPSKDGFQLLQDSVAHGAFHDLGERFDPPKCHKNTRVAVLQHIVDWIFRRDPTTRDAFIMWLYGPAGAGKSAIVQTIAEQLVAGHHLVSSFFFSRNHPTRGNAKLLVPTLAYQLALSLPCQLRQSIIQKIEYDPLIFTRSLEAQFSALITMPLEQLFLSGCLASEPYLIIIDGLDECDNREMRAKIIDLAFRIQPMTQRLPLLFLVASRPEVEISSSFESSHYARSVLCRLILDDKYLPHNDIRRFLEAKFTEIKVSHPLRSSIPESWPSNEVVNSLVVKSSGQFIYASTVAKFTTSPRRRPVDCLDIILGLRPIGKETPFAELDALYTHILTSVDDMETVLIAVGLILLRPNSDFFSSQIMSIVTIQHIESLLLLRSGDLRLLFQDLHSLVLFSPGVKRNQIQVLHGSLGDFLFDRSRSKSLWVSANKIHSIGARLCLKRIRENVLPMETEILYRLWYHCPCADPDPELIEDVLNFTFHKLLSYIQQCCTVGDPQYNDMVGEYIHYIDLLVWDSSKINQFKLDQLKAFYQYLMLNLEAYLSELDLLLLPLLTTEVKFDVRPFHYSYALPKFARIMDRERLNLRPELIGSQHLNTQSKTHYRDAIYLLLHDPVRSGRYFFDEDRYVRVACNALSRLTNARWAYILPRSLSKYYIHIHRNFPTRWRQKLGRKVDVREQTWSIYKDRRWRCGPTRDYLDQIGFGLWRSECRKNDNANYTFKLTVEYLPRLLEKSGRSDELIDIARSTKFGSRAKNYPKELRQAKRSINKYLTRSLTSRKD